MLGSPVGLPFFVCDDGVIGFWSATALPSSPWPESGEPFLGAANWSATQQTASVAGRSASRWAGRHEGDQPAARRGRPQRARAFGKAPCSSAPPTVQRSAPGARRLMQECGLASSKLPLVAEHRVDHSAVERDLTCAGQGFDRGPPDTRVIRGLREGRCGCPEQRRGRSPSCCPCAPPRSARTRRRSG